MFHYIYLFLLSMDLAKIMCIHARCVEFFHMSSGWFELTDLFTAQ